METNRVLDPVSVADLGAYVATGGGEALQMARGADIESMMETLGASGLRGRGGAGFPTATKWSTVASAASSVDHTVVVINAAEGEPGTFKDRLLLRRNPYRILEGALVAARVVGARSMKIGIKASFAHEIDRLTGALAELASAGWTDGVDVKLVLGPSSYLFGEETAMLEVIEGRQPFPRVSPPFRRGLDEDSHRRSAGATHLAVPGGSDHAPVLVDNVETFANVPLILTRGAGWFRELGTAESPGTIICTVSGDTRRDGVAEVPMGTSLRELIHDVGWGTESGRPVAVVAPGTSNALLPGSALDVPLTYEDMARAGSGLGSAGFLVFDRSRDPLEVALGISWFLAVESCGQCDHCKRDGLAIAAGLESIHAGHAEESVLGSLRSNLDSVSEGARCNLAYQQETVVRSVLELFPESLADRTPTESSMHRHGRIPLIAPIVDIVGGRVELDVAQRVKHPDWRTSGDYVGESPAERLVNTPVDIRSVVRQARRAYPESVENSGLEDPFEVLAAARHELHDLLLGALDDRGAPTKDFVKAVRRHLDATARILEPMAQREDDVDAMTLAEVAAERAELVAAMVEPLEHHEIEGPRRLALLRAVDGELRRRFEVLDDLVSDLHADMDPEELDRVAQGLQEARLSSIA